MVKTGTALQVFFSKILHGTYATHNLHREAEKVRSHFNTMDKLIASVTQIFKKKTPSWLQLFQNTLPRVKLPP